MFRLYQLSKSLTNHRPVYTRLLISDGNRNIVNTRAIIRLYSSDDKNPCDVKSTCDSPKKLQKDNKTSKVQSHPQPSPPKRPEECRSAEMRLKECKPIDIHPCKPPPPGYTSKIPPLTDCPTQNLMTDSNKLDCEWYKHNKNNRKKYLTIMIFGILFTIVTIGAMYFLRVSEKPAAVITGEPKKKKRKRIPATSAEIPPEIPYLLIGGGTASFSAFRAIKSADPKAKVLVITDEFLNPYMRPPLSKEIWFNNDKASAEKLMFKQWNGTERSLFYEPDDFYIECKKLISSANGGVAVARGWRITHLDVPARIAYLDDGAPLKYEKCLIATGAKPKLIPVFAQACAASDEVKDHVKTYRSVEDFENLSEAIDESLSVAVVGGGFLGSELACSLAKKGKAKGLKVYQIFPESGNMGKVLPEYLSLWTMDKVKEEGVTVYPSTEVISVRMVKDGLQLVLKSGQKLTVDQAIVAVGVKPNTELAEKSDLEVDPDFGGYLVNTELQARSNLYIAGDCSCFYDVRLGRRRIEHHDHAVVSGRLAGENMTGAAKPYLHQSMFWSDLGPDVGYEAIGIVDSSLPTVGVFAKATAEDNPKAIVTATNEGDRSLTEEYADATCKRILEKKKEREEKLAAAGIKEECEKIADDEDFGKGVIFYLRDDIVVGIVLWNVFNRMSIARQVLKDQKKYDDLNEVAKLFNIHEE